MVSRSFGIQVYKEGEGTQREGESKCAFDRWRFRESLGLECDVTGRVKSWPQWDRQNVCR